MTSGVVPSPRTLDPAPELVHVAGEGIQVLVQVPPLRDDHLGIAVRRLTLPLGPHRAREGEERRRTREDPP